MDEGIASAQWDENITLDKELDLGDVFDPVLVAQTDTRANSMTKYFSALSI